MLRRVLIGIGVLLVLGGLALLLIARTPGGLAPAGAGALLLLALAIERHGYKRIEDTLPGPDWQLTGERFRDPGGAGEVAVYFQPVTGERRYVRLRR